MVKYIPIYSTCNIYLNSQQITCKYKQTVTYNSFQQCNNKKQAIRQWYISKQEHCKKWTLGFQWYLVKTIRSSEDNEQNTL